LVDLERAILLQARELDEGPGLAATATPRRFELPPALDQRDAFVGRERELATLWDAWHEARNGHERLVEIVGDAGMGKTRLIAEFARRVADSGATVLYGACTPSVHIAYQPFVNAITTYVQPLARQERAGLVTDEGGGPLERLVPELGRGDGDGHAAVDPEVAADQRELFEAFARLLSRIADVSPTLLVIDDVQWATESTVALVRHLLAAGLERPLVVVIARRDDRRVCVTDADATEPPREVIALRALTAKDVDEWLRVARPGTGDLGSFPERVCRDTDGVPLFIREFLRTLTSDDPGAWPPTAHVATTLQAMLEARWRALSDGARALVGAVAAMEPDAPKRVLDRIAGLPRDWESQALDEAVTAGFLTELPGDGCRFAFTHRVLRDYADSQLTGFERATVHRDIVQAMQLDEGTTHALLQLARHAAEAAPLGQVGAATNYALRAAHHALEAFACGDAIMILKRALSVVDPSSRVNRERRVELLLALSEAYKVDSDRERSRDVAREAAFEARDTDPELLARAAVALGDWGEIGETDIVTISLLEDALKALGDEPSATRCRVLAELAGTLTLSAGDPGSARRYADEALALSERLGHPPIRWRALLASVTSRLGEPCVEERLALATEMTQIGRTLARPNLYLVGMENEQYARAELGDLRGFASYLDTLTHEADRAPRGTRTMSSRELSEPQGMRFAELPLMSARDAAFLAMTRGDWTRAEQQTERLGSLATNDANYVHSYGGQLIFLRREQGRSRELLPAALEIVAETPHVPAFRGAVAMLAADAGELDIVREQLSTLLQDGLEALPRGMVWTAQLTLMTEGVAALRDRGYATLLLPALTSMSGQMAVVGTLIVCMGAVDRYLGMLETVLGDYDSAEQHFEDALDLEQRLDAPPLVARTNYWYARMLLLRNRTDDPAKARACLTAASEIASALGMTSLAAHATTTLEHEMPIRNAR
jgi:tetratricopeptide (TPR) repeat protein